MSQPNDYYDRYDYERETPTRDNCYDEGENNYCRCTQMRPTRKTYSSTANCSCICSGCRENCRKELISCLWVGEDRDCQGRLPIRYHLEAHVSPTNVTSKFGQIISNLKCIAECFMTPEPEKEDTAKPDAEKDKNVEKLLEQPTINDTTSGRPKQGRCKCLCGLIFLITLLLLAWYYNMTLEGRCSRGYKYKR